jgi:hypothetical protein
VAATSRRRTAAEIGLSPRGLLKILSGTRPHPATLRKLEEWYAVHGAEMNGELSIPEALSALLAPLPPEPRAQAFREALTFFRGLYARNGVSPPAGFDELS